MQTTVMLAEKSRASRKAEDKSARSEEESSFSLTGKRVVVVEDEGITQLQLRRILRSEGMDVVGAAANGQEAITVVFETKPDLVLMDIRMPVMDGLEAARRILERYHVCIVMLTAFSEEEYRQQAQEIGACGYVTKPVTAGILLPQLAAALQKFSEP